VTTDAHTAAGAGDQTVDLRDPYPFFAQQRRASGDTVFRDGRVFVRPICNELIDEFIDAGETDLVRNFTFEFPTRVIARLLGLPDEDLPMFRTRAVQLISYNVHYERAFEASAALKEYFAEQIEKRKSKPTEDIIGDLVSAEIDGEKLSAEAIYSFLRLLLPAGLETTYRSSGNLLHLLLTNPGQFTALQADREPIGQAIEEGLRFETPLTTVQRFTTEDTEVEGVKIPARSLIGVCIGSANRDEQRCRSPFTPLVLRDDLVSPSSRERNATAT
jgi:cytochrome P450